jgi:putative FmdB family regulatory protein
MPIYEYYCEKCDATFEKFVRSMSAVVEVECPTCHSKECKKVISRFATTSSGGAAYSSASTSSSCAPSG